MFTWDEIQRREDGKVNLLYRHERIFEEGLVSPGFKVLDIGGWGVLATRIIEEGAQCTILDNFTEDQYYPDRVISLPHIRGDILKADEIDELIPGTYDLITCFEMLEHCVDQPKAVENIYNLLKPTGILVGTFPIPGFCHTEGEPDITFLDVNELNELLSGAGFSSNSVEKTPSVNKGDSVCSLYYKAYK